MVVHVFSLLGAIVMASAAAQHEVRLDDANRLFVVGGTDRMAKTVGASKTVDAFDLVTGKSTRVAQLPTARDSHGVAALNGLLYAIGGLDEQYNYLASVDVYVPNSDAWFASAPMNTTRAFFGVCALANKIYAVGGYDGHAVVKSAETYDPSTKRWSPIGSMATARHYLGVACMGGLVYAVGGNDFETPVLNTVEAYDPTAGKWTAVKPMQSRREWFSVGVVDGNLYAFGGYDGVGVGVRNSVEVFEPATADWRYVAEMPVPLVGTSAAPFNGLLYLIGGDGKEGPVSTISIYDPKANMWNTSTTLRLSAPAHDFGVAVL